MSISRPPSRRGAPARRRFLSVAIISTLLLSMILPTRFAPVVTPTAEAVSTTLVISQFQVAGGTAADEFVELHNVSSGDVDLNGHRVVYRSAAGTSDVAVVNWTTTTIIPAGGYYLIGHATGYDGGGANITFPGGGTGTFAAAGGGLAIRNGAANTGTIVDSVGYGTATNAFVEGAVEPAPAANASAARLNNGCTDTDNNASDFVTLNPSAPRNASTTPFVCGAGGPTLGINDVSQDEGSGGGTTNFTFTVTLAPANATQTVTVNYATANGTSNPATGGADCSTAGVDYITTGGTLTFTANDTSEQLTVQVCADTTSEPNETFFVNLSGPSNATVGDGQGLGTIVNDDVTITPIFQLQGSGFQSPYDGQVVTTTGIVTGRKNNGYFLQDPDGDGNQTTSDAIFVFTSSAPTVQLGQLVRVTGTIDEFESSTSDEPDGVIPVPNSAPITDPKTLTEIVDPAPPVVLSSGNGLPAALDAASLNIFNPATNPAPASRGAQLERYEAMRVSVGSVVVSQPTNEFGEFWGVEPQYARPFREPGIERGDPVPPADEGPHAGSPPPAPPIWDGNFERIMIDSDEQVTSTAPVTRRAAINVNTGATVTNIVGPLDFARTQYTILLDVAFPPGQEPVATGGVSAFTPVPVRGAQEFTVGHTNLEFFTSSNATKMNKASLAIRNVMRTPDILGLIEVDTTASAQALANKVNADAADPANVNYVAYFGETSTNQDIGYLVNTARVTVVGTPAQEFAGKTFTFCGETDTLHDRPPFVLTATVPQTGGGTIPVTVILNHTKSLIAVDSPRLRPSCTTPATEGARNREKRRLQAEDIADMVQTRDNAGENIIVLGDLNAFEFNDGLTDIVNTIKGVPPPPANVVEPSTDRWTFQMHNLVETLTPNQRYSFLFEGNAQVLDHILVNTRLLARANRFAFARFNADFSEVYASDSSRPERVSDHDAPVAYFTAGTPLTSGSLIISEYRLRGPGGPGDEFVELYNNTDLSITVSTTDNSSGWSLVASDGVARFTIPTGTVIPARGHYLGTNSTGYSLGGYPGGNDGTNERAASGDVEYTLDIPDGSGIALFNTANPSNFNDTTRLDAVGYSSNLALYREGAGLAGAAGAEIGGNIEYSFLRDLTSGTPKDTNSNAADFIPVDTTIAATTIGARLGAPGPENLYSPIRRLNVFVDRLDQAVNVSTAPNRVRTGSGNSGTLSLRRRIVNHTGGYVTRLRFRINDITAGPAPAGTADLRAVSSSDIMVTKTNGEVVPVQGTVLEEPPVQPNGGGWNTSWAPTGTINLESPMAPGAAFNVQFLLNIQQAGTFRIVVIVEALP
ncbi:MAG TPA: lamin tail domain-containing protein [Pyrinomonadaceae bacterium]|nr:lamin tail domain-containing protein [Pyrinomonadaceae bacterium]